MVHYESSDGVICIRPVRSGDEGAVFEAIRESIDALCTWMAWAHPEYGMRETMDFVESADEGWRTETSFPFAVTNASGERFLGTVGLNRISREYQMCNLGYWVRTSDTGRGIAARATHLAARFALRELGLSRVEIVTAVENLASQRTAEKAGARREGILRHRLQHGGQPRDAVMFSLITGDVPD